MTPVQIFSRISSTWLRLHPPSTQLGKHGVQSRLGGVQQSQGLGLVLLPQGQIERLGLVWNGYEF